ncbi:MAG: hydroxymethylglutaryl-CoA reductase, degradative [Candidatus Bathyarchaeota archaeon]
MKTSIIQRFYNLSLDERLKIVADFAGLTEEETLALKSSGSLPLDIADRMIENVVGVMHIPLGVAVNFIINGKPYMIPMAIEEPSVVAAASHAAKLAAVKGGFYTSSTEPIMIGQIQVTGVKDPYRAKMDVLLEKSKILEKANEKDPVLVELGGGAKDLNVKVLDTFRGQMLIVELHVDCKDAMGANTVNTMAEAVAPLIERITGGKVLLRIVSNLATLRISRAKTVISKDVIGGEEIVDAIVDAYAFAASDPYRCATHNKGIMNGVVAVALATGNDTRALEAGAHAYAARTGRYLPLTTWEKNVDGDLAGTIEIPTAVGIVGGATRVNPIAKICLKILGVKSAREFGEVLAAVGLAQNFAALRALATEGIQRGHMRLHARNIAIAAGAEGEVIEKVVEIMVNERQIRIDRAKQILEKLKQQKT